jgi:hypothetical protein
MKVTTVKKYTCDFCRKSKYTPHSMRLHEKHCTMNPQRECRMCYLFYSNSTAPIDELIKILGDGSNENFKSLRDYVGNCPACILAALRQANLKIGMDGYVPDGYEDAYTFDFKQESKKFLEDNTPKPEYMYLGAYE